MDTLFPDAKKRRPFAAFETGTLVFLALVFVAAGAVWRGTGVEAGATSYAAQLARVDADNFSCGLTHFALMGRDAEERLIRITATASGELVEGAPFARFSVSAVAPGTGERIDIAEAALVTGTVRTQDMMSPVRGEERTFVAIRRGQSEALTLPLDMLAGTVLSLRLAGDIAAREVPLPRVADNRVARQIINCFTELAMRLERG